MYALRDVQKIYGHNWVLRDLNCEIPTDGFVFVMGPSGAGKSTLLRLLSFIETPDRGVVSLALNGDHFDSLGSQRPWPRVTCVFQRQFLWPHLTLRQNVLLPLRSAHISDPDARLQAVIKLFDMASFVDRYPNEVSGGQAQRAALARAFVLRPELILIDEAHGGLDLDQQRILNEHLVRLRAAGVGLIVVTHSLSFARDYADQVVVLEDGTIVEIGPRAVFDAPRSLFLKRALQPDMGLS